MSAPQWYFQSRRKVSPFFALLPPSVMSVAPLRDVIGDAYESVLVLYDKGCYQFFMDSPSQLRIATQLFATVERDPEFIGRLIAEVDGFGRKFLAVARRFLDGDLSARPASALKRSFHRYREAYNPMFARSVIATLVDRPIITALHHTLAEKIPSTSDPFAEVFTVLSTSPDVNWHLKEEERLRAHARRALKNLEFGRAFAAGGMSVDGVAAFPDTEQQLHHHTERFGWLPHDREGDSWTYPDIVARFLELAALPRASAPPSVRTRTKTIMESQARLLERFSIPESDARFYAALRQCVYLKHFRKTFDVRGCLGLERLFAELERRFLLPRMALLAMTPDEVEQLLDGAAFSDVELLARRDHGAFVTTHGAINVFAGILADPYFAEASVDRDLPQDGKVQGLTACPGRAEGPARLVFDAQELKNIIAGDVMVVLDVLPEYIHVLRRCSGLIADGGATITSHVATIAREVGLPTLVGALHASKVFSDGVPLELNATKGWARMYPLTS